LDTVPFYREVKIEFLHKVPMWDFVQVTVVATRVPSLVLVWSHGDLLCQVIITSEEDLAGKQGV